MKPLNRYFDHTLLKPEATATDIKKLCGEAAEYDFYSVCVNSCYVKTAADTLYNLGALAGTGYLVCDCDYKNFSECDIGVKVSAVVGFPLGGMSTEAKSFEAAAVCGDGASEIDMVINIGALKEGRFEYVLNDIAAVTEAAGKYNAIVKVIIETCLLTDGEKEKACRLAMAAGAAFIKTSTGFSFGGATVEDIKLVRRAVGDNMKIKASGGIRDFAAAISMIEAGADRIGASASVDIIKEASL